MSSSSQSRISRSPSLAVRMVLVAVLTPMTALGLLAAVAVFLPGQMLYALGIALMVGAVARQARASKRKQPPGRVLSERDDPELFAVLDRLCLLAGVLRPDLVLRDEVQPNSWVVHLPRQTPRVYLTTGLRELLSLDELTAVLAHELTHIANRDALVMSVVGMPGSVMLNAGGAGLDGLFLVAIGLVSQIGTTILSRYRELAADAGSAAITGRPSALSSALLKVSDSLQQMPVKDLRAAAKLNVFNLIAVPRAHRRRHPGSRLLSRLSATHPPLQARLDALDKLERAAHNRRP